MPVTIDQLADLLAAASAPPVCPDCRAPMRKEVDQDVDGVMHVHWICECEWIPDDSAATVELKS